MAADSEASRTGQLDSIENAGCVSVWSHDRVIGGHAHFERHADASPRGAQALARDVDQFAHGWHGNVVVFDERNITRGQAAHDHEWRPRGAQALGDVVRDRTIAHARLGDAFQHPVHGARAEYRFSLCGPSRSRPGE